ncbi:MAG: hypothetical protein JWM04_638 [Verrucomicrobiales bacterium]|nr:hypothetical protein [Verrucomicrobiales bacterium]
MADILKIFLIVVGLLTVYVCYWLLAQALFPKIVQRASELYAKPVKFTFIGLIAALIPVIGGLAISNLPNPAFKLIGLTCALVPAMLGLIGSAGLTLRIGNGMAVPGDETQPWRRVLRGGILLSLSFLLPVIGWVILPVWCLISGFGVFITCVRESKSTRSAVVSPSAQVADFTSPSPIAG